MAHAIMDNNAMFSVRETPWHRLGIVLDQPPTTSEALEAAKLDWEVYESNNVFFTENAVVKSLSKSTYRIDNDGNVVVLGNVGLDYEVLQNVEAFGVFDILTDYGFTYETAGALNDGKNVWILAKGKDHAMVSGNDRIDQYLLLSTSHDGSSALQLRNTFVRVVCANTHALALSGNKSIFSLKHTKGISDRVSIFSKILGNLEGQMQETIDMYNEMDNHVLDNGPEQYFESVEPKLIYRNKIGLKTKSGRFSSMPKKYEDMYLELTNNYKHGVGNKGQTLFDAWNAITEYVDHGSKYGNNLYSIGVGAGSMLKKTAFNEASKLLNNSSLTYFS